jgi:Flp pilus assembly CpaF family ATPase
LSGRLAVLTAAGATFLDASVRAGLSVVVSGGTQVGKTTKLKCLSASIPGQERVVSCEEVFELRFGQPEMTQVCWTRWTRWTAVSPCSARTAACQCV